MIDGIRVCAIVPAAGSGRRMGRTDAPSKALIPLGGTPVLIRTLRHFQASEAVDDIVVLMRPAEIDILRKLVAGAGFTKVREIIPGGRERQDSVRLGVATGTAEGAGIIVVHDAVRPLITADLIDRVIRAAFLEGASVAAVRPKDTVKVEHQTGLETPDRGQTWLAQTPQAFRRELLTEGIEKAAKEGFLGTDDVSLVERLGRAVSIVEGSYDNLKITTPGDVRIAELLIGPGNPDHDQS